VVRGCLRGWRDGVGEGGASAWTETPWRRGLTRGVEMRELRTALGRGSLRDEGRES
jgi:hypothetical protein